MNLETVLIEKANRKYAQWKHWFLLGHMTYLSGGTGSPGYVGAGAIRGTTALHNSTKVEWDSQKSGSHVRGARLFSLAPITRLRCLPFASMTASAAVALEINL